jgi:peptidoglycan biosynthesis protein MviN/MurJ (putative lipid II flippase)
MNRYWFRPKRIGYGATPATWEGWVFTLGCCAVIGLASWLLVGTRQNWVEMGWVATTAWALWLVIVVGTSAALLIVSKRRTDGEWRWRFRWNTDQGN